MSFPFATQDAVDKWLQSADYSSANLSISETIHVEVDAVIDTLEEVSYRDFVFIPVRFLLAVRLKKSVVLWNWEYDFNESRVYEICLKLELKICSVRRNVGQYENCRDAKR